MIGKWILPLPFIFANKNYTLTFTFLPFSFTFSFISKFNRKFQIIITRSKLFSQHFSFKQEFMLYFDIFYVFLLTFVSFRYKISL